MLAKDGRMLDLQRLYEANEKNLSQRDEDIRRLRTELKKYAKIQAMIHQLSDGAAVSTLSQTVAGGESQASPRGFVPETQYSQ
ncbi:unnamed protein product [Aphanomyces euteiches]